MKKKSLYMFFIFFIVIVLLSGCSSNISDEENAASEVIASKVVGVSIPPEVEFVQKIAGDEYEVITMLPEGENPKEFIPSDDEVERLSQAEVVFLIGLEYEKEYIDRVKNLNPEIKVVDLSETVLHEFKERILVDEERDPNIWMSLKRIKLIVEGISTELSLLNPNKREIYKNSAQEYITEINELDKNFKGKIKEKEVKKVAIFYSNLGYLAEDYGLEVLNQQDFTTEATEKLKNFISDNQLKNLYYAGDINYREVQELNRELELNLVTIDAFEEKYLENMKSILDSLYTNFY